MAEFSIDGLAELQTAINSADKGFEKFVEGCLQDGADICKKKVKQGITRHGLLDSGQLLLSIGIKKKTEKENKCVYVTPKGKRENGERNGTVAFVQNYGRSNMSGTRFWTEAEEQTKKEYEEILQQKTSLYLREKGLQNADI